jgi:cellulose synthase/poly-beta-1,6-N-acetylglucosamine synthase-like glycosyltransferase
MLLVSLTILLCLLYSLLILYYRKSWSDIPDFISSNEAQPRTSITVIIPARNEEKNIKACIQSLMQQTYPHHLWEAIIVDDHSTDRTAEIVQSVKKENISVISLQHVLNSKEIIAAHKKRGIEAGIKKAAGELIVTTDADCTFHPGWLHTIASFYQQYNPSFIAAPVAFTNENSFLKIFQSLDFLSLQGITGASVYKKFHSMCNGANLAYEKKAFEKVGGFSGIDHIASGDDMLLMHKIYKEDPSRVLYLKSGEAVVCTQPAETIADFFQQRIRWASKAGMYEDKRIFFVLLLVYLFNFSMFVLVVYGFFNVVYFYWFAGITLFKTFVELVFLYPVAAFFNKKKLLWFFLPSQPFHILYTVIAGFLGQITTYEWKGRKVK